MDRIVNIGVIGCGTISESRHIPTVAANRAANLTVLCDVIPERAAALAERFGVPRHTSDAASVFADAALDAVIIATPALHTPDLTIAALRAGKHVLCEKPMAFTLEKAKEVMQAERASQGRVQVGFTYRHGPLMNVLRSWIREGKLGSPLVYRLDIFDETWDPAGNPEHYRRIVQALGHGPPIIHDGAHVADFLHFLIDAEPVNIQAVGLTSRPEFPDANYNAAIVQYANGDVVRMEIGYLYPHFPTNGIEVLGPCGTARVTVFHPRERYAELRSGTAIQRVELQEDWVGSCFREQLETFLAAVRGNGPFSPGSDEGYRSLELTKRIEEAIRGRGTNR